MLNCAKSVSECFFRKNNEGSSKDFQDLKIQPKCVVCSKRGACDECIYSNFDAVKFDSCKYEKNAEVCLSELGDACKINQPIRTNNSDTKNNTEPNRLQHFKNNYATNGRNYEDNDTHISPEGNDVGQIKLNISRTNSSKINLHIIMAKGLTKICNARNGRKKKVPIFIQVDFVPRDICAPIFVTKVAHYSSNVIFHEHFGITISKGMTKQKMIISVKQLTTSTGDSVSIGVLSFAVFNITKSKKDINGWFHLKNPDSEETISCYQNYKNRDPEETFEFSKTHSSGYRSKCTNTDIFSNTRHTPKLASEEQKSNSFGLNYLKNHESTKFATIDLHHRIRQHPKNEGLKRYSMSSFSITKSHLFSEKDYTIDDASKKVNDYFSDSSSSYSSIDGFTTANNIHDTSLASSDQSDLSSEYSSIYHKGLHEILMEFFEQLFSLGKEFVQNTEKGFQIFALDMSKSVLKDFDLGSILQNIKKIAAITRKMNTEIEIIIEFDMLSPEKTNSNRRINYISNLFMPYMPTFIESMKLYQHKFDNNLQQIERYIIKKISLIMKVNSQTCDFDFSEFLHEPKKYHESLTTLIEETLTKTCVASLEYKTLNQIQESLKEITKVSTKAPLVSSNIGQRCRSLESVFYKIDPDIEKLQKKLMFPPSIKPFNIAIPNRHQIFSGSMSIFVGISNNWKVAQAILFNDSLLFAHYDSLFEELIPFEELIYITNILNVDHNKQNALCFQINYLKHDNSDEKNMKQIKLETLNIIEKNTWILLIEQRLNNQRLNSFSDLLSRNLKLMPWSKYEFYI